MAKLTMKDFMKDSKKEGGKSDIINFKEKGKAIVWLHPETGIESRKTTYIPVVKEVAPKGKKGGKKEKTVGGQLIVLGDDYNSCPVRRMITALRNDDSLSDDDVIFEIGEKKNKVEYLKGDIIGTEGYDWKKRVKTNTEYIFGAVDKDNVQAGTQILIAPKSLGKAITNVIENQMEQAREDGDIEQGDPFINPYAFKLVYDENEQPTLMYRADFFNVKKMPKEVQDLLDGDGVDVDGFTRQTPVNDICNMIADILVAEIEGYDVDDFRVEEDKQSSKKAPKKAPKKIEADDIDEEDEDEDDEDEEEEAPKSKKKAPKKASKKVVEEDDEDEEDEEDEEEEEEAPKPKKGKKETKKAPKKSSKKKVEEDDEEDEEDEEEEEAPKPKKGKKETKKAPKKTSKKKVEDEEEDEEDEEEEEAPKSKKKGKKETKKKAKVECPSCGELVDEDATECPECEAEFDDESLIICPECGTENEEEAEKCKKCKTKLLPF